MVVAVIGSRTFTNYNTLAKVLDQINNISPISEIVSGGAKGTDSLSEIWASLNDVKMTIYLPEWDKLDNSDSIVKINKYGNKYDAMAGMRRNKFIVNAANIVIAFWDGESKGTLDSIQYAKEIKKPIKIFVFDNKTQEIINSYQF